MKTLFITLKKVWFDMTDSGEKPEEYRELTLYWYTRLCLYRGKTKSQAWWKNYFDNDFSLDQTHQTSFVHFDQVSAMNGYNPAINTSWTRKFLGIEIREGKEEWGAEPGKEYFVIKLGERV